MQSTDAKKLLKQVARSPASLAFTSEIRTKVANDDGDLVARAVRNGLMRREKQLPAWLFYDAEGSRLYEEITEVPEYYPVRTERAIFERHADAIAMNALSGATSPVHVSELGAGTATKSQIVLHAVVARQGVTTFMPTDVSWSPLAIAVERIGREEPYVELRPIVGRHENAFDAIRELGGLGARQLVMFIGSSIGNYGDDEAVALLRGLRGSLRPGSMLLLGTDLRKDPATLIAAYDDAAGVTAAFNKNLLVRMNRELGAHFDVSRFRHVAVWNAQKSRIEMHLESLVDQLVPIDRLGVEVPFRRRERIHTESSVKYDDAMIDSLLARSGFGRRVTYLDDQSRFAVNLARAI